MADDGIKSRYILTFGGDHYLFTVAMETLPSEPAHRRLDIKFERIEVS